MSDVRLIDANALNTSVALYAAENAYLNDTPLDILRMVSRWIAEANTISAVPVVRCRECFYKDIPKCCPYQINGFEVVSNWYCPMGVRKMDAKEEDHAE